MSARTLTIRLLPVAAVGALALSACGGGSSGGQQNTASTSTGTTVAVRSTSVGMVLTDSAGHTLYFSNQEKGAVRCDSSACNAVWAPLTVSASTQPTAPAAVSKDLSTVTRPDGVHQVALNGRPLYTFSFDRAAGDVNGNGQTDSFNGTQFTWHAAATGAAQPVAPMSPPSGYNY